MKYKVIIRQKAEKQLNKLDDSMKLKIMRYIKQNLNNTDNPKKFGKALRYNLKGFWRYRVENYRIIAKIEKDKLVILIVQIDKRDKIYI
ncbi:type II toxin-antitoxin system RelE/ParE family toxin [Leptotrichia sp. oral taxon 879]|uniref:Type II toxin-antitoxin system RelE/ParE family toxin n=1 Tax=Leptotrichia mesophila TaxID=3239303 RepID=A0AB39V9H4_9FUSO|nr:type II toxin-antitoxin system RelE/ParE family toxin [Leptotrichia sp. oral taxon 879]ERK47803.1 addiction module toxin, RelE/StbE family [Leptotrichia sp. oral taxon 879 str. F0557]